MIRLSKSSMSDLEKKNVLAVLEKEYLGMSTEVKQFEEELSAYFGRRAVCVNTGTSALHLAFQAAGIGSGDEVLMPSLTFVATFQAVTACGGKPIPCEVEEKTLLLDLKDLEKRITKNTKAICLIHYTGNPGNLDSYYTFAKKHDLRVVEDAAHAFGTNYKGKKIGSFGDIVCFSFDGIKNITCGEGGCVVSSDSKLLDLIADARLLGVVGDTQKRFEGKRSWEFDVVAQGWRYHMSDVMAAIGRAQLARFPGFQIKRQELAKNYVRLFQEAGLPIELLPMNYDEVVPHIFVVKVLNGKRDFIRNYLNEKDIQCGMHYQPNHFLTWVKKHVGEMKLPVTEKVYQQMLTLPMHVDLTFTQQEFIINTLAQGLTTQTSTTV